MAREGFGTRVPVDFRVIEEIQRSPSMLAEQGPGWLSDWGGPQMYTELARSPVEARVVYYAVLEGTTTPDQLEVVTGLSSGEVSSGLAWLRKKGLVT